jgi:hypothetical protein
VTIWESRLLYVFAFVFHLSKVFFCFARRIKEVVVDLFSPMETRNLRILSDEREWALVLCDKSNEFLYFCVRYVSRVKQIS